MKHPCGNLPISGLHCSLWYCWHHQCWWLNVYEVLDDGGDTLQQSWHTTELGPFDQAVDALELAAKELTSMIVRPDAPWGSPAPAARPPNAQPQPRSCDLCGMSTDDCGSAMLAWHATGGCVVSVPADDDDSEMYRDAT